MITQCAYTKSKKKKKKLISPEEKIRIWPPIVAKGERASLKGGTSAREKSKKLYDYSKV